MKRIHYKKHLVVVILAVFWIIMFALNSGFRTADNFASILREASTTGIAALGMTLIIIMSDFDLSIGSMLALLGMVLASTVETLGLIPALILACLCGALCGLINGVIIAYCNVPAFITTLGTYYSFRALAYIYNDAKTIMVKNTTLVEIGNGSVFGIPIPFLIMLVLSVIAAVVLNRTVFGRNIRALGNSIKASNISGINTKLVKTLAFVAIGFCTAISSIIVTGRQASASPDVALNFHFDAITVVVLGGTKLSGGEGSIFNTLIASILYASVANSLSLYHVDAQWQRVCMGAILLLAFSFDFMQSGLKKVRDKSRRKAVQSA